MINTQINELVAYGLKCGLVSKDDQIFVTNQLLDLFRLSEFHEEEILKSRPLAEILEDMVSYAHQQGILEEDTIAWKDLFDTRIMGLLTPLPSVVRSRFQSLYQEDRKKATDYFYKLSQDTNYIRTDRIEKDEKWVTDTEYGPIDITINLSKPEKDPRDIARAGAVKSTGYPSCLLCKENEGFAGNLSHPARQNHRVIPIKLGAEQYFLQYSPYVYYNEHCIIFNEAHRPMKIDQAVFRKLLEFVKLFPHYTAGSNADLPIVGGSILSHDHFQGGHYEFAMERAGIKKEITIPGFEQIEAGIVNWPMSVIRIRHTDAGLLVKAASHILESWRKYTDEDFFIYAQTDGEPHNTITPIARMRDGKYEFDLVLRNNITTKEHPLGVFHPHQELHHIKKENIGLIEVMGLAVLPARLKNEMKRLGEFIVAGKDISSDEELAKHADWVETFIGSYDSVTQENVEEILQKEIGEVFKKVLEHAGVYKNTKQGMEGFMRFISGL